jgi:SMI1 / KNR4 family (SUKH-1)
MAGPKKKGTMTMYEECEQIIELIRAKCRQEGYFGPDDFRWRRVAWARPLAFSSDFAFPCATEEQLHETEQILGFPLPPFLRALYLNLASGGFGPGGGIRGPKGGYGDGTFANGNDETIVKFHTRGEGLVDLGCVAREWQRASPDQQFYFPVNVWPGQLLPICDLGDVQEVCSDPQGRVYLVAPSSREDSYLLQLLSPSLEKWLERWLRGERLTS